MTRAATSPILLWIWLCAWLNCAGWGLSALHQLNAAGYAVALLAGAVLFFVGRPAGPAPMLPAWGKLRRRFRRPFPLAFLCLATLAFLGGALYAPANFDGLAYRLPRILHWLAAGGWHWIHSVFPRVNGRACGIEWISAPLIVLSKTDRLLFLINLGSFLLLPGLIFSVFTRLGVRRRTAWHWMWLAPSGYGFVLQAGSIGNDLFGAPFVLAAMDFALRAKSSRSPRDIFASVLAAALMTGAKTSNLPLLLPWAIAIFPALSSFRPRLRPAVSVGLVALFASVAPILVANAHYYHGDWAGLSAEGDDKRGHLALRTAVNTILGTLQNLTPPVFPTANAWNRMVVRLIPAGLSARIHATVTEPGAAEFKLDEMQMEENAGLGCGLALLLLVSLLAAPRSRAGPVAGRDGPWLACLRWSPFISLVAILSQSQVSPLARILLPYYLLLLPAVLAGSGQELLVTRRWWRAAAATVFLAAGLLIVITPPRPLFPAPAVFAALRDRHPRSAALSRAATVYTVYHDRSAAFAPALAKLPPGLGVLGLFTYDDPETSLWQPFGSRRIEHVMPGDTAEYLNQRGIHYVLLEPAKLEWYSREPAADWVRKVNGAVIGKIPLQLRIQDGTNEWWLVRRP